MSPINQDTIRVEKWTDTKEGVFHYPGEINTQVIADGDIKDPGVYVYKRGVLPKDIGRIRADNLLVDVRVDEKTGQVLEGPGVWRRFLPGSER